MDICGVYLIFQHERGAAIDKLVRWVTGGKHIHVESVFAFRKPQPETSTHHLHAISVGSIYPDGVYAGSIFDDPFYELYDRNGQSLPVNVKQGGLGWTWVDVTSVFVNRAQRLQALEWSMSKVNQAQYRTSVFVTFPFPSCGRTDPSPKESYICSEFCADMLLEFGHAQKTEDLQKALQPHCDRFVGMIHCGTDKLSPQGLYEALTQGSIGTELSSVAVRQLLRAR